MSKRLLCVWLPNWPIQRIQAEEPALAERPLLLSTRDPRRGLLVTAANLIAKEEGIRPAMRLSEATALVEAEVREHDPQEDLEQLCHLAEQAQQFSPIVGLEQLERKSWAGRNIHQPECLQMDITGIGRLFGSEADLIEEVGKWLREQSYFACMALAGSVGTAWAIANYGLRRSESGQQCVVPEEETPERADLPVARFCIVEPGQDDEALSDLSISALRINTSTVDSLRRLGIMRIGQLSTLPRGGMATRLGDDLIARWDQARGHKEEPVVSLHSLPDWCLEQSLEFPTENRATLEELLRRHSLELSKRLAARGQGALRLVCRMDLVDKQPLLMQLGLFRPTNDAEHLETLLVGQLEQTLREHSITSVWRFSLQATMTADMVWRQADLFEGEAANHRNQMARLIDTLSSRLGRKQVLVGNVKRESQPELAYDLQPMTGRKQDGKQNDTVKKLSSRIARRRAEPSPEDPLRRPSHLFSQPKPIEVAFEAAQESEKDELASQTEQALPANPSKTRPSLPADKQSLRLATAPSRFLYQGKWEQLHSVCGPERLESGWWRGPSVRRDYYRVETKEGGWWWIFRDLQNGKWFLHGMFD
ncbi:MAG: DNA polymerase Y family protein [Planctomycetota bacterium]